jgi:hypothetical protein
MAFFDGHPDYEAVEAMIQYRGDGSTSIRAILTRHDQTQVDHVNHKVLLAEAIGIDRPTYYRAIGFIVDAPLNRRHARLDFVSHAGEQIVLDITTVGQPDRKQGGISDPGSHSPNSSLPLMWRGASALAGPQTVVMVDGRKFDVPVKISAGSYVAHKGYFTERHTFGAIRAGTMVCRLKSRPNRAELGAEWKFECDGQKIIYRIVQRAADGELQITKLGESGEVIAAFMVGEQLLVTRISRPAGLELQSGLHLTFGEGGKFRLSMENEDVVTGRVEINDNTKIDLYPTLPRWASSRRVRVVCSRDGDLLTTVTRIGDT